MKNNHEIEVKVARQLAHSTRGAIATLQLKIGSLTNLSSADKLELIECVNSIRAVTDNLLKEKQHETSDQCAIEENINFVKEIRIIDAATIVIVDDDIMIHNAWKIKLKQSGIPINEIHSFFNPEDFNVWIAKNGYGKLGFRSYFFDYDLKSDTFSGLDLIEHHDIALESLLISGLAGETEIYDRTKRLGVSCLRKDFLSDIPIVSAYR